MHTPDSEPEVLDSELELSGDIDPNPVGERQRFRGAPGMACYLPLTAGAFVAVFFLITALTVSTSDSELDEDAALVGFDFFVFTGGASVPLESLELESSESDEADEPRC